MSNDKYATEPTAAELSKYYEHLLSDALKAHDTKMNLHAGKFSPEMRAAEELERMAVSRLGAWIVLYHARISIVPKDAHS